MKWNEAIEILAGPGHLSPQWWDAVLAVAKAAEEFAKAPPIDLDWLGARAFYTTDTPETVAADWDRQCETDPEALLAAAQAFREELLQSLRSVGYPVRSEKDEFYAHILFENTQGGDYGAMFGIEVLDNAAIRVRKMPDGDGWHWVYDASVTGVLETIVEVETAYCLRRWPTQPQYHIKGLAEPVPPEAV